MTTKLFLMGSGYFFSSYSDYKSHDTDYVAFEDDPQDYKFVKNIRGKGNDFFYWRRLPADEMIELTISNNVPMQIGKFLIPEVAKELGITIDHLRRLIPLAEELDDKHKYEKIILDAYLLNGDFVLTDQQRTAAYLLYKKYRKEFNS